MVSPPGNDHTVTGKQQVNDEQTGTYYFVYQGSRPAMSNRNCLLNQKLCHYINQGRTLTALINMTCFDLSKLTSI